MIATTIVASLFWASLTNSSLWSPAKPCFASLPRVTVWLQSREVHSGHDLLPPSAAGKVFLVFVDLTKAFDLVSRSGLFKILQKIGCPPKLLAIITSFYQDCRVWSASSKCGAMTCWAKGPRYVSTKLVLSPLLYGSKLWTTYARQERRLNRFHLRCLRGLLHIRWQDRVTNTEVLERAGSLSMLSLLIQRRLQWLGHAHRMEPDRLPREILYGELQEAVRCVGWPLLRYKDVIKRDLRSALIDTSAWEDTEIQWRQSVKAGVSKAEANARVQATCKRAARKEHEATCNRDQDRATQSYKILPKSPALTIASSRRGCH